MKLTKGDKIFNAANIIFMFIFMVICLYPMWYCFIQSLSNLQIVSSRDVWIVPVDFTWANYKAVFQDKLLVNSLLISVQRTLIGASVSVLFNALAAYALSKPYLVYRKFFTVVLLITMYFGGGLVPWYLVLRNLRLVNNFMGYIIPSIYAGWTIIVMRTFFKNIPAELEESAKIDGATDIVVFFRIILPLSTAMLATMFLFSAVGHWNDWFLGDLLMRDEHLLPLSTVLMRLIIRSNRIASQQWAQQVDIMPSVMRPSPEGIKMAAVIVATVPIIIVYPFLQKYFAKGVIVGSLKG
jgi:putative aldouronate transport system permease protein